MQIHVEVLGQEDVKITIFSKSKRESTIDRINTHAYVEVSDAQSLIVLTYFRIICAALGLPIHPKLPKHASLAKRLENLGACRQTNLCSIILEAEVVPYNEGQRQGDRGPGIEEFWWLGPAGVSPESDVGYVILWWTSVFSYGLYSPSTRFDADRRRHLCLVFFDVLLHNGDSLLNKRYDVIREIPGFVRPLLSPNARRLTPCRVS
jgi:DNA ligase-4